MKKKLLVLSLLAIGVSSTAQVLSSMNPGAIFYVGEDALVYNGGGLQTLGNAVYDVHGNVMIEGSSTDVFRTRNTAGTADKTDGGNIILRLNNPANYASITSPSTYGQLYLTGISQGANLTGIVDKEYRAAMHGTYQQIALPFYNKVISSLNGDPSTIGGFGKFFSNIRYSRNEVLTWNNATVVSENLSLSSATPRSTAYYMLGSNGLDTGNPPATMPANYPAPSGTVFTLRGVPFANGTTERLVNAANGVNFGPTGDALNSYRERYNSYLQDDWDYIANPANPWATPTFGRNMYQFGNPYFTNLDLGQVGVVEGATTGDGNAITSIQGIRYDPGSVVSNASGTYSVGARFVNFTTGGTPTAVGDVGLIIKPMQTFVIKLRNNNPETGSDRTLNFDTLRRFRNTPRADGTNYSVDANRGAATVKQLGLLALNSAGEEISRAYYVVYPTAISGHTSQPTTQSILGNSNIIGTYEEDKINGGADANLSNAYWLYINEANETDFRGKAIPLALYSNEIKSLKFEIRENTKLLADAVHSLSTGTGFYYKAPNGTVTEIAQNQVVPVTADQYSLYFGKPEQVLGTDAGTKPSRTMVVYNRPADNYVVRFDPSWSKADVKVYDMSGKLVIEKNGVSTNEDFVLILAKTNTAYMVTAVSDKGEKMSSKIIR